MGGLHTTPALVSHDGPLVRGAARAHPAGRADAARAARPPAGELGRRGDRRDRRVRGPAAGGGRGQPDWAGRFAVLDRLLLRRAAEADADRAAEVRPEVRYAWRRLRETSGGGRRGRTGGGDRAERPPPRLAVPGRVRPGAQGGRAGVPVPPRRRRSGRRDGGGLHGGRRGRTRDRARLRRRWRPSAATTTRRTWPASSARWPGARPASGWPRSRPSRLARSSDSSKPRPLTSGE